MDRKKLFLEIFNKAEKKFGDSQKRLAGEKWSEAWQTLIATILSAQSRDEVTIPIAEELFRKYATLESLARAKHSDVLNTIRSINYNRTKAKHAIGAAKCILNDFHGSLPVTIDELVKISGVGRKTANLVMIECHGKDAICIDTHCHRIANVLGIVKTKTPYETELELMKIAPREYWSRINRILVLWGKKVPGRDRKRLLAGLE
ncbi:endonuclease III [Candidatus Woesearchaeota archaeon]|nr:endonuclease III [Candidatus Woesearchaeota archaeon]